MPLGSKQIMLYITPNYAIHKRSNLKSFFLRENPAAFRFLKKFFFQNASFTIRVWIYYVENRYIGEYKSKRRIHEKDSVKLNVNKSWGFNLEIVIKFSSTERSHATFISSLYPLSLFLG